MTIMKKMKKLMTAVLLLMSIGVMLVSCSKSTDEAAFIPKDALFVCDLNAGSVMEKGDLNDLKQLKFVATLLNYMDSSNAVVGKLYSDALSNPASCGVDINGNVVYFCAQDEGEMVQVVMARLTDVEAFKTIVNRLRDEGDVNCEEGRVKDLDYVLFEDEVMALFDENRVLFVIADGVEAMQTYGSKYFNLKKKKSMLNNKHFAEYWKNRSDVNCFLSYDNLFDMIGDSEVETLFSEEQIKELSQMAYCFYLTFDEGSIVLQCNVLGQSKEMQQMADQKFNKDLMPMLPEQTLAATTFAFNADVAADYIAKMKQMKGYMDLPVGVGEYTVRDIIKAFGGSMAVNFYGFKNESTTPLLVVAADVKNTELVEALLSETGMVKNGDIYTMDDIKLYYKDGIVVYATDEAVLDQIVAGGYDNAVQRIADNAAKGDYVFIDLNMNHYPQELYKRFDYDPTTMAVIAYISQVFDYVDMQGANSSTTVTLHLNDASVNSLKLFVQMFDQAVQPSL